jgi:hypothetical protein
MTIRKSQPEGTSGGIDAVYVDRDALLETFAAELTLAAYCVALRTKTQGTWLDLELDLWRALADTVKTWGENL